MAFTQYVLNRGFCPFYNITHESISNTHGNGTTINYTALGTQMLGFAIFRDQILQ